MVDRLRTYLLAAPDTRIPFLGFAVLVLLSLYAALATGYYLLAGLPAVVLLLVIALFDFRVIFWLLIACLPLSTEVYLPNGLGTDLPTEPLIFGLMLVYGLYLLQGIEQHTVAFFRHPLTLLLLLHVCWIYVSSLFSDQFVVSLKFSLAKTWYVATFFLLAGHLLRSERDVRRFFWVLFWPLVGVTVIVLVRHSAYGFSFADIYRVLYPFHRNHVNYAAMMAIFFPWLVLATGWYRRGTGTWWLLVGTCALLFVAIYLSYTRAAYISLAAAAGAYFIIRWRLMRWALLLVVIAALGGAIYITADNRYLDYAPNYDRTISHEEFDNLIEATYKMEDISTMERVYRWVAAGNMAPQRPVFGWGPGNFVNFYRPYTVTSFRTYVSDNEEGSGIHSYYLMTLVEQGVPGLLLFLAFVGYTLIRGETIYHRLRSPRRRRIVLMALLSIVVIDAFQLINDLLETDKVGSLFFLNLAILINQELSIRRGE